MNPNPREALINSGNLGTVTLIATMFHQETNLHLSN
jgi:hypothetical protein